MCVIQLQQRYIYILYCFRCRVWVAQILDVIHHDLLLQHHSDLYRVIRHENANLLSLIVFFLLSTVLDYCAVVC